MDITAMTAQVWFIERLATTIGPIGRHRGSRR
jgi:hypothetical protein